MKDNPIGLGSVNRDKFWILSLKCLLGKFRILAGILLWVKLQGEEGEMSGVIPVAFSAKWSPPVCLVQKNTVRWIRGPREAICCMRTEFADQTGPAFHRALDICFAALRREADLDVAKTFFVRAFEDDQVKMTLAEKR